MAKKAVKQTTYVVVAMRGIVEEMCRYEGGTFEVLEVIKHSPRLGVSADTIHAQVTSPYRNDGRWASFGVRWSGESQLHQKGLVA